GRARAPGLLLGRGVLRGLAHRARRRRLARGTPRLDPARLAVDGLAGGLLPAIAVHRIPGRAGADDRGHHQRRIAAQEVAGHARAGLGHAERGTGLQQGAVAGRHVVADAVADVADEVHHLAWVPVVIAHRLRIP